jgi:hypothetical protein
MCLTRQKHLVKPNHDSRRKAVVEFLIDSRVVHRFVSETALKKLGILLRRRLVPARLMLA